MEYLDIVDESGLPTGEVVSREVAHDEGIRHRTSHVWILRIHHGKVQVLLQKRSKNKDSHPGCFDISSAGHIPAGSGYMESAIRELKEELGVECSSEELKYCGTRAFSLEKMFHHKRFYDNQVSNVYVMWLDWEIDKFSIQKSEIDEIVWMDFDDCMEAIVNNTIPNCIKLEELEMIMKE